MPAGSLSTLLGLATGGGALLAWYGIQRLRDRKLPDAKRRQGWWGVNLGLRPVEIQDSIASLFVIQARDGTVRTDGRPMGEDGAALPGQAD